MKEKCVWIIWLGVICLALAQLACGLPIRSMPGTSQFDCEMQGGTWRRERAPGEVFTRRWCETPTARPPLETAPISPEDTPVPPTAEDDLGRGECIAPKNAYNWKYEDFQSSSGTGGVTCNARFVVTNTGSEPLLLVLYTAFDNNKLKSESWGTYSLQPGELKEEQVNRTNYSDGVVTYSRVDSILVVRDVPECAGILTDDSQAVWKAQSIPVDEISCP